MRTDSADFTLHNSNGFRSIPSTDDRILRVEFKIDQMTSKLDMILDSMTKPTQYIGPPAPVEEEFTFSVPKANIAPGIVDALNKAKEPLFKQPAQSVEEEPLFKQPAQSVEEEPRRMSGLPAKQQIEQWIARNFETIKYFRFAAEFGLVTAKIEAKSIKANSTHRYTHRVKIKSTLVPGSFNPTIFGIDEAREVVAYLESLGVNVNTSALYNK